MVIPAQILPMGEPWLRRILVTLGPLEEWRGAVSGETITFCSDGTPKSLKVTASFQKALMGMPSPSKITVYNLARNTRDAIRSGLTKVTVQAGWDNSSLHTVFQGSVVSAMSERSGTDIITTIKAIPGYGALVRATSSRTFAAKTPVMDAVQTLASDFPGVSITKSTCKGLTGILGPSGWSFAGNTRDGLTQLATEHGFSWHINDGVFKALGDTAKFGGTVDIRAGIMQVTPILNGPLQMQEGVTVKALYTPGVIPGSCVYVQSDVSPKLNGEYRVHTCDISLDAYNGEWTMGLDAFATL